MKLTKTVLDRAKYTAKGNGACYLWDDDLPGFGVRVFPSGRKSFVTAYRNASGQKRFLTIGPYPVLTLHQARDRARIELANVLQGADPQAEKALQRAGETVEDLCKAYMERHAKAHKRTWKTDQGRINRYVLPAWGARKVDAITRADVAALHRKIATESRPMIGRGGKVVEKPTRDANGRIVKKDGKPVMRPVMRPGAPYEANRCLEVLKRAFNLAVVWGFLPDDHRNPCVGIQRFKETKRDRWVTHEELPALAKAIDAEEDVFIKAALWLYLFTGCRRAELLSAKWEQVNFDRRELRLPETKSGRAFTLPLSAPAVAILDNLPQVEGCPYVFPAKFGKTGHLVNIDKPWRRIRAAAGVPDCRLHDLRRTVGSWLAMDGASLLLIGKTLNQTSPAATAVYSRLSEDPVRAALERHAEKLVKIATGKPGAEIVELPRKAGKK